MIWSLDGHPVDGQYPIIYADPPWQYRDAGVQGNAQSQYETLSVLRICQIPVWELAAPDAALFLWVTWPTLLDGLEVMKAWGFEYKNCAFAWVKTHGKANGPFLGLGHWTRGNTEACLLGVRGKMHRLDAGVAQIVHEDNLLASPLTRHSRKPPEVRDRIIRLLGDLPAVELFSRESPLGWDRWGNEAPAPSLSLAPAAW